MANNVTIKIPNQKEYIILIRLAVAALAQKHNIPINIVEEIKLATTEACNMALRNKLKQALEVSFELKKRRFNFSINSKLNNQDLVDEDIISHSFIKEFMDEVTYGEKLTMCKKY